MAEERTFPPTRCHGSPLRCHRSRMAPWTSWAPVSEFRWIEPPSKPHDRPRPSGSGPSWPPPPAQASTGAPLQRACPHYVSMTVREPSRSTHGLSLFSRYASTVASGSTCPAGARRRPGTTRRPCAPTCRRVWASAAMTDEADGHVHDHASGPSAAGRPTSGGPAPRVPRPLPMGGGCRLGGRGGGEAGRGNAGGWSTVRFPAPLEIASRNGDYGCRHGPVRHAAAVAAARCTRLMGSDVQPTRGAGNKVTP